MLVDTTLVATMLVNKFVHVVATSNNVHAPMCNSSFRPRFTNRKVGRPKSCHTTHLNPLFIFYNTLCKQTIPPAPREKKKAPFTMPHVAHESDEDCSRDTTASCSSSNSSSSSSSEDEVDRDRDQKQQQKQRQQQRQQQQQRQRQRQRQQQTQQQKAPFTTRAAAGGHGGDSAVGSEHTLNALRDKVRGSHLTKTTGGRRMLLHSLYAGAHFNRRVVRRGGPRPRTREGGSIMETVRSRVEHRQLAGNLRRREWFDYCGWRDLVAHLGLHARRKYQRGSKCERVWKKYSAVRRNMFLR
jgi:hypothetical protein